MGVAALDARQRVLGAVETSDGTTRAELAEELGLPLGTVTTAVTGLLRAGALAERPAGGSVSSVVPARKSSQAKKQEQGHPWDLG